MHIYPDYPSLNKQIGDSVRSYIDTLKKPPGSLGRLEELAIELADVAFPILQSATSMLKEMTAFQSAGINKKQ
jgi:nicotinate-nucleotide--dimethylbenzimidazole phosphoribosyltransferase